MRLLSLGLVCVRHVLAIISIKSLTCSNQGIHYTKLLWKSINIPYRFEWISGKFLSSLHTDDTKNGLLNDKNDKPIKVTIKSLKRPFLLFILFLSFQFNMNQ